MIREKIVEKLNSAPFNPELEFTHEEIQYMLNRYLSTHTRNKVENVKLHHYIDDSKEKIGLSVKLKHE